MLKIFLVFYTASGGVASVSKPIGDMEFCESIAQRRNEQNLEDAKSDADIYVAECEQHKTPPKVTVKLDAKTREHLRVNCIERGFPNQCSDLPNGDLETLTSARDKDGHRIVAITKPDGRRLYGT
ncbi:hypothetical protein IVB18_50520 (plasmid) [Bradyrhizobium sp. 186]|uniref:hypothetical protein n=1 Tax=Bradyrhizobium sp. 186 TaxID=2782654 RepID=UPI0020009A20|nr:hypothetical protein [Bradyrhizobium sp. 186]UPK40860.1 hypothetical protein IVB18_50520 [Bradyrhizobium sp. 186]